VYCLTSETNSSNIDVADAVCESVAGQTKRIGAEGVCLYNLRTGGKILAMDGADEIGLRKVQLVITTVDENTLFVQQRAHGPITEHWRRF